MPGYPQVFPGMTSLAPVVRVMFFAYVDSSCRHAECENRATNFL